MSQRVFEVLIVEDSPSDSDLMLEAISEYKVPLSTNVVQDGEEAMAYLLKQGSWVEARTPDLIFLDLNLPRMDGRDVLRALKDNPELKGIPVIVMTTSASERDVLRCYELQAASYIVKPIRLADFLGAMKVLGEYWFRASTLPTKLPPVSATLASVNGPRASSKS